MKGHWARALMLTAALETEARCVTGPCSLITGAGADLLLSNGRAARGAAGHTLGGMGLAETSCPWNHSWESVQPRGLRVPVPTPCLPGRACHPIQGAAPNCSRT